MLDYISAGADGSTVLEIVAVLVPALVLHDRDGASQTRRVLLESRLDLDQRHRLSYRAAHHVPQYFEQVARPERTPLPRGDHSRGRPLRRRSHTRSSITTTRLDRRC
jgi:hypothetical protein